MPFQPKEITEATLKGFVDRLHRFSKTSPPGTAPQRAWSQEAIARALGFPSFHAAQQAIGADKLETPFSNDSWRFPAPHGRPWLSRSLSPQPEEGFVHVNKGLLDQHVLLLAREAERAQALTGLIRSNLQQPVLLVRGPASTLAAATHGLLERSFNAFLGYSAGLDCLFATGSARDIGEALCAELDEAGGDNAMWRERAISLLSAVLQALVWLRDNEQKRLDRAILANHLVFNNSKQLANHQELPSQISKPLEAYFLSLPGYQPNATQPSPIALEQHGFLQMQFTRVLGVTEDPLEPHSRMALHLAQETRKAGSLSVFLEAWAQRHQNGLLVFDGLSTTSAFYEWLTTSMGKLETRGHSVVVGARSLADLSDARNEKRITSRLGIRIVLKGSPESDSDASKLLLV